jgi:hypothetical protein
MKKSTMIPLSIVLIPAAVWAEFFIDIYGGSARTTGGNIISQYRLPEVYIRKSRADLDGSNSATVGLHTGYWFQRANCWAWLWKMQLQS